MNEIIKSTQDALSIADTFYKSGMFTDIKSQAQAMVKIMAGSELGIPPFAAMSGIHIIAGKPTIGAGLMAAKIKGSGKYNYKVVQADEKACVIDFYEGKEKIGTSSFTIEDAKKAGTKNIDKFPKNMLFARAISNGVKWYTPDIYDSPVYVPEEMQDITVDTDAEVINDVTTPQDAITMLQECTSYEVMEAMFKALPAELRKNREVIEICKQLKTKFNEQ